MDTQHANAESVAAENAQLREHALAVTQRAAFDRQDDYRFHDPASAFAAMQRLSYLTGVKVGPDGSVNEVALRKAIRSFAQDHAFMVQTDEVVPRRPPPPFPSGGNVGTGRARYRPAQYDEAALRKKYPALNQ